MNNHRCKKWIRQPGDDVLRCEAEEGHYCVHYNGGHWWPNKRPIVRFDPMILGSLVTLGILAAITWWLL